MLENTRSLSVTVSIAASTPRNLQNMALISIKQQDNKKCVIRCLKSPSSSNI